MSDQLTDEQKELYLDVLKEGTTPFDRFVSRGDVEDPVDIPNPRREIDRAVMNCIKKTETDKTARFIPMLGAAGSGKTHAFWAFKDAEKKLMQEVGPDGQKIEPNWTVVYIPSPPTAVRILFHIYTCLINEIPDIIDKVSKALVHNYGGDKKKFGFFGKADIDEIIAQATNDYPGVFADCVKTLITYGMETNANKRAFAKRWLLGEAVDEKELEELKIQSVIESDDVCLAMIKLISKHLNKVLVLYFDEFESPYRTHGPEAEVKFLETLKRIYNEVQNVIIVAAILKDIWPRVLDVADAPFKSRMEPEVELKPFTFGDVKLWFAKVQEHFWSLNNLDMPPDPLFPLNEPVLKIIFDRTHGNPRETIKLTRVFIDKLVYGDLTLAEITEQTKPEAVPAKVEGTAQPVVVTPLAQLGPAKAGTSSSGTTVPSAAQQRVEDIIDKEGLIVDVNPASVLGAVTKGIQKVAAKAGQPADAIKVTLGYKFFLGGKEKEIGALVEFTGQKVGVDIPAVKSFDRSGGVAAFYSAKRLVDGLTNNTYARAIIIMPESTSGEKTQYLFEQNPGLLDFKLNQKQAEDLIRQAMLPD
ncbi:MAG: hypothetical protein GYA24_21255, partial [Candidatus Lokiarchaeota archaeon]|nr:hypothetical protein [Candidatus Lokiarchaeota archaeon]